MNGQRLPSLPLPPPGQAVSSGSSSPRGTSFASSIGSYNGSQSSFSTAPSSHGPTTPSPSLPVNAITGPPTTIATYDAMNQGTQDMYYSHSMSAGQPPQSVTSSAMSHYPHQQPPLLQTGPQYSSQYHQYYHGAAGLTSPPAAPPPVSNTMGTPQNVLPLPGVNGQNSIQNQYAGFDHTGQQPPPGMKPRVTATLWEDEGSLCFQVEARGICVARREDNHMINGTKLLNVAGMTRGRRDGILKSEKMRHVVKIGPMHLKGVWIPYERALDFANKEKITELLYPLFVHNISTLLYHPANQPRSNQVMAAAERRKQESGQMRTPSQGSLPSIQQTQQPPQGQHQPMGLPGPQPQLPPHNGGERPSLDRAHTFPTSPGNTPGIVGNLPSSESFNWHAQGMNGPQGTNPTPIDASLSNTRSMPNTPATTSPGPPMQNMQSYPPASHGYESSRMYQTPAPNQSPYQTSANGAQDRMYGNPSSYAKNDMAPPAGRPATHSHHSSLHETKPLNGLSSEASSHPNGEDEGDHEHDTEYTHDSGAYDATRAPYNYTAPGVNAMTNEAHLSPELTGSPNHPPGSGRATPRTAAPPQPYYSHPAGYNTPPRVQQSSSNLYNVMTTDRAPTNGANNVDVYAPPADMSGSMANGYAPQPPMLSGAMPSMKRGREDDEELPRVDADTHGSMSNLDLKRRKTMMESSVAAPAYDAMNRPASAISAQRRR